MAGPMKIISPCIHWQLRMNRKGFGHLKVFTVCEMLFYLCNFVFIDLLLALCQFVFKVSLRCTMLGHAC